MSKALRTEFDDRDDVIVEVPGDAASLAVGNDGRAPER